MSDSKARRQYTDEEKAKAVALAREKGLTRAAAETGLAKSTIWRWRPDEASVGQAVAGKASADTTRSTTDAPAPAPAASAPAPPTTRPKRTTAKSWTPSQKAEILEHAAAHGVTAASEKFGASRFSIYDWQRRVKLAAAGEGPSPTSGPAPADIEARRDKEILAEWHHQPGLGPSQIVNQLRRKGIKVSTHTVTRVMEEAGWRPRKVRREPHDDRFEAVRPNQLWHLDFLHRNINKSSVFTLVILDDYSRFAVGSGIDDAERADLVIGAFQAAVDRHGRPDMVLHDKGSAFWSWKGISRFTDLLTDLGIDQVVAEHKEWNGKSEVFNANLAKELFDVQRFASIGEMARRLDSHLHWYNHRRTHHALGGLLVPADRYYGRVDEVMARIESGAGGDVHTDALRERCLELFKVVSRDGVPEVWLLGKRLVGPPTG
jgi:transposase InsO family protein